MISEQPTQLDLFLADILDVGPKGEMQTMEYPLFSLSTKPDVEIWRYEYKNHFLEVIPSAKGRATIFDKDLLLYTIGQLVAGRHQGRKISRAVVVTPYDYLKTTGRGGSGKRYELLAESLMRLRGTTFRTDMMGGPKRGRIFGLVEEATIGERDESGRIIDMTVVLSEWLFDAVTENNILKYSPDYFKLRKPNDRRMYELCRKHCGRQQVWHIKMDNLYIKFGTRAKNKEFRRTVRQIIENQSIPEYKLGLSDDDVLWVTPK